MLRQNLVVLNALGLNSCAPFHSIMYKKLQLNTFLWREPLAEDEKKRKSVTNAWWQAVSFPIGNISHVIIVYNYAL